MELNQIIQACQNETNFDELCYLKQVLGPQRQPRNTLIPLTCVYLLRVSRFHKSQKFTTCAPLNFFVS